MTNAEEALGSQEPKAGYPRAERVDPPEPTDQTELIAWLRRKLAEADAEIEMMQAEIDDAVEESDQAKSAAAAEYAEQLCDIRRALGCPAYETTVRWAEKCGERLRRMEDDGK